MLLEAENAIKAAILEALGESVAAVETHSGRWDDTAMQEMAATTPSVYVGFTMASRKHEDGKELKGRWHIYLVSSSLEDDTETGVYSLFETVLITLHDLDLDHEDALNFKYVKSRFDFAESQEGYFCYEMVFDMLMHWPDYVDDSDLDAFERYHADNENTDGDVLASSDVELEQE